jgi:hypothetical protein
MRVSTTHSLDLFAESAYYAYRTDPECIARRALLDQMIDPDEYGDLFVPGWGRPSWPLDPSVDSHRKMTHFCAQTWTGLGRDKGRPNTPFHGGR